MRERECVCVKTVCSTHTHIHTQKHTFLEGPDAVCASIMGVENAPQILLLACSSRPPNAYIHIHTYAYFIICPSCLPLLAFSTQKKPSVGICRTNTHILHTYIYYIYGYIPLAPKASPSVGSSSSSRSGALNSPASPSLSSLP